MSQIVVEGHIHHKLDLIANVFINSSKYFTVYRRYNSPYDILIEDANGDIHQHKDYTIRDSLKTVLCLNDDVTAAMHTLYVYSFKHNANVSFSEDVTHMRWSDIQKQYQAININVGGILLNYTHILNAYNQAYQEYAQQLSSDEKPSIYIPKNDGSFIQSESDHPDMSVTFQAIRNRKRMREWEQYDNSSYSVTNDTDNSLKSENYIELRNRTVAKHI
jgi:hypothetical protein